jgi:hypothetical protein
MAFIEKSLPLMPHMPDHNEKADDKSASALHDCSSLLLVSRVRAQLPAMAKACSTFQLHSAR